MRNLSLRARTRRFWFSFFILLLVSSFIIAQHQNSSASSIVRSSTQKSDSTNCIMTCDQVNVIPGAPIITTQPQSQTIPVGNTVNLSVVASGTDLTYQWYLGTRGDTTNPIGGATLDTFTSPTLATTTRYWVRVSNASGSADSNTAIITVPPAPAITTQPQDQTIFRGQTADLAVAATGDNLTYQWYLGTRSDTTNPIGGATSDTFTTPILTFTTHYWVRVSNPSGNQDSRTTTVTVLPPPSITTQPQSQTINNAQTAHLSVVATGSTLTYQWYQGTRGDLTNPIGGATSASFTTPTLTVTTRYWVRVTNPAGSDDSDTAVITVLPPRPVITTQPQSQSIFKGQTVSLSVVATGDGLTYQWYQGTRGITTNPMPGATSPDFTSPALTTNSRYWVRVTNVAGNTDSSTAVITILPAPSITTQPQSQTIFSGHTANLSVVASGSGLSYQWYQGSSGNVANPVGGANSSTFTTPALTNTTNFWVRVSNPSGHADSNTAVITVVPGPPVITTQPQSQTIFSGQTADLSVVASGSGLSYQWYQGNSGDTSTPLGGETNSSFTTPALSSTTSYWVRVSNSSGNADSDTAVITVTSGPIITTQPQSQTILGGQTADLSVVASGSDLSYQWYQGNSGDTSTPLGSETNSSFTTPALSSTTPYWVRVTNPADHVDSDTAVITVTSGPIITTQPQSQTITSGQTANLSVVASGSDLSYQWYQGNSGDTSAPISGATNSTFTTPVLTSTTSYWVRVSNPSGDADSDTAIITVTYVAVAGVSITPTTLQTTEGAATSYQIQLQTAPSGSVTLRLSFDPAQLTLDGSSSSPLLLTFTDTTPQIVEVAAIPNANDNSDRSTQISHEVAAGSSAEYLGMSLPNVTVMIGDVPPPPPSPLCSSEDFDEHGIVRTGIPNALQYAINCRVLYQNGQSTTWLGEALYNSGSIGIEGVVNLGVKQAIDIFSPAGMNYFEGGAVFCLKGEGKLIWMAASHAPRIAEIIGSYTVPDFPGFTCATLFEPGTLVLVRGTQGTTQTSAASTLPPLPPNATALNTCRISVTNSPLNLRTEPDTNSAVLTQLPYRASLKATAYLSGWYRVTYHRLTGWVSEDYVRIRSGCTS